MELAPEYQVLVVVKPLTHCQQLPQSKIWGETHRGLARFPDEIEGLLVVAAAPAEADHTAPKKGANLVEH